MDPGPGAVAVSVVAHAEKTMPSAGAASNVAHVDHARFLPAGKIV